MSRPTPLISVVVVTPDSYRRIRRIIQCLRRQSAHEKLEVVIVAPSSDLPGVLPEDWEGFLEVKVVSAGLFQNTGHPRAVGVSHSSSDIVAFVEDHCFPHAGWAECLATLQHLPWAGMSPALENGNPGELSWADFLLNFGPAVAPTDARAASYTPWHNTAYKRAVLDEYGDRLEHMLEAEIRLQQDLVQRGYQLYLAADIRASHVNISRWTSYFRGQFLGGRIYGAARAEVFHWLGWKRALYACASPLIPFARLPRVLGDARRTRPAGYGAGFLFACACGLAASACGEAVGYLVGAGDAGRHRMTLEFERHRHIRPADLILLEPE